MRASFRTASVIVASLALATLGLSAAGEDPPKPSDVSVVVSFPEKTDPGQSAQTAGSSLFKSYCASCHGSLARGDGPLAEHLRYPPPDLTLLAKRNAGTFDKQKVRRIVDGRDPVKGHGGPDMPLWGDVFKRADEGYSEEKAAQRIQSLVEYLATVQRTP